MEGLQITVTLDLTELPPSALDGSDADREYATKKLATDIREFIARAIDPRSIVAVTSQRVSL